MGNTNEMMIEFDSRSCNEGFARVAVAAFVTQLNPTLEEVADIKTAISEAITNSIIHGYENEVKKIRIQCSVREREFSVSVIDYGKGIEDIEKRWNLYLQRNRRKIGQEWDLHLWKLLWIRWK